MTVGLFGGSFDPIHHGHLLAAQAVLEALALEEIRFVPAREQPFKTGQHRAPAAARARMVALAVAGEPRFQLEPIELERPGPSYSVDTLRALQAREPQRRFALLVGADAARDLPQWREADQLHRLAELVVFARPGSPPPELPWPVRTVTVPAIELSATEIRQRVATGRSVHWRVPEAVAEFIRTERLYLPDA